MKEFYQRVIAGGRNSDGRYGPSVNANQLDSDESLGVLQPHVVLSTSREGVTDVIHPLSGEESHSVRQRAVVEKANKKFLEQRAHRPSAEAEGSPLVNSSQNRPLSHCFQVCSTRDLMGILFREENKCRQKILEEHSNSWKQELPQIVDKLLIKIFP